MGRIALQMRPRLGLFADEDTGAICPDLTDVVFQREYAALAPAFKPAGETFGAINVSGPDWAIWRRKLKPATDRFPTSLVEEWTGEAIQQIAAAQERGLSFAQAKAMIVA